MMNPFACLLLSAFCLLTAAPASAQGPWEGRVHVSLNGGVQATTNDFRVAGTFEEYVEEGSFDARYRIEPGPAIDGGLVYRLWRGIGAGVAFSYFEDRPAAEITARIPHPLYFERFRDVAGTATRQKRTEAALHVPFALMVPAGGRLGLAVFGGPSVFTIEQNFVDDVRYREEFPFDSATFDSAVQLRATKTVAGFHGGGDVVWRLGRRFGVGALVRYTRARVSLKISDRNTVRTDIGGLHTTGGIRMAF